MASETTQANKPMTLTHQATPAGATVSFSTVDNGSVALLLVSDGERSRVVGAVSAEFAPHVVRGFNALGITGEVAHA